jgi:hypothetical protein
MSSSQTMCTKLYQTVPATTGLRPFVPVHFLPFRIVTDRDKALLLRGIRPRIPCSRLAGCARLRVTGISASGRQVRLSDCDFTLVASALSIELIYPFWRILLQLSFISLSLTASLWPAARDSTSPIHSDLTKLPIFCHVLNDSGPF